MSSEEKRSGRRSIAIFGLSANPPTGDEGHEGIVRHLVQTESFDEIWILPVYQHMFIGKRSLESYDHRLAMCKLCFEALGTPKCVVRILPIERDAYMADVARTKADPNSLGLPPSRLGTIDIVNYIKQDDFAVTKVIRKEASNSEGNHAFDLHLVLGYDTFLDLMKGKWKDAVSLTAQVTLEVFQREGITRGSDSLERDFLPQLLHADINKHNVAALGNVSSTTIRAWSPTMMEDFNESILYLFNSVFPFLNGYIHGIKSSKIPQNHINKSVFHYIKENNLYFYSIQSRRKRLIFNFFRVIILLALVFIVIKYFIT